MPATFGASFNELPDWYKGAIRSILDQSEALRQRPYPNNIPKSVAAQTPYMDASYNLAKNLNLHEPYLNEAHNRIKPGNYAAELSQYMNPYQNHVLDRIRSEGERTFNESILPAIESKFVRLGQHGSSRHAKLASQMGRDLQGEILKQQRDALHQGYTNAQGQRGQEKLRELETARLLGNMGINAQRSQLENINVLNSLGLQQQNQRQNELNENNFEFWRREGWPQQQLAQQASMVHGIPFPMSQTNMSYAPPPLVPSVNNLGQMGSMAGQMYSLGKQGGFFKKGGSVKGISSLKFKYKKRKK